MRNLFMLRVSKQNAATVVALLGAMLAFGRPASATLADGAADAVLGQADFTSASFVGCGRVSAPTVCGPFDVAVAPSGRLYVADTDNNRVLSWENAPRFANGEAADIVLGQPDFTSRGCNTGGLSATSLCFPKGVGLDRRGSLYVADSENARILRYDRPRTNGQPAAFVLGQPDFTTGSPGGCRRRGGVVSAQTLCSPRAMAVDPRGRLYVTDEGNGRVLRFERLRTNGQAADLVLGVPGFTSQPPAACTFGEVAGATRFCGPRGIAVDRHGALYVADGGYGRVLRFERPRTNGQAADLVLGQPDFTGSGCNFVASPGRPGARSLCSPNGVAVDRPGNLYVADGDNNRVLRYSQPRTNGQAADLVLGQPDFSSNACNLGPTIGFRNSPPTATSLCLPLGIAMDLRGTVYLADAGNNRILRYDQLSDNKDGDDEVPCFSRPCDSL